MARPKSKTSDPVPGAALVATGRGGLVGRATDHVVAKAVPFLPPWFGVAILPPAFGVMTHEMWGDEAMSAGLACAGLGTSGVLLSALTWSVAGGSNRFRKLRRAHATASVAAGMGWLTCATASGPFATGVLDFWLFGGGLFAASWNIRQLMRNAHDESEQVEKGGFGKLAEAIGLEKFQLRRAKGNGKGMVTAEVGVPAGGTIEDMQAAAPKIAAALHIPPSGITVTRDPDNAAHGCLSARVADLLKDGVAFEVPREPGLLPTEPIPVGLYADGETMTINPYNADILQHLMIMGVTGAGKSEFARAVLAHLMTRRQMTVILVDLAKGRQTVGHIKDGLDWFITDKREAKHLLRALPAAIKARGDHLASENLDQWSPDSTLNAVCVWLEEAADLADFEELDQIARAARSVGIWLVISLQRATWTNMSTDVRANLQASACFGVNDAGDAGFCLPDKVLESGAIPDWGSDRPGYAYATGMGIPAERWTTEWRGAYTDRDTLAALVHHAAAVRDPLDETTANAFGLPYTQRTHRGTNHSTHQRTTPTTRTPQAPETTEDEDAVSEEINNIYDEVLSDIPADPEPDADYADIRLDDDGPEAAEDSDITFKQKRRPEPEEARHILYTELDGWARQGRLTFEPADAIPATVAAGRTRPWLQGELKKLVELGVLNKDGYGEYTIVQSPLVPA